MDIFHQFGSDLQVSANGDLLLADGPDYGTQRVLRRLLTNPFDYIWQPAYGAGLARFVGQPAKPQRLKAITRSQMAREAVVAHTPAPTITVDAQPNGIVTESIQYADAGTGQTQVLEFPVTTSQSSPTGTAVLGTFIIGTDRIS